MILVVDTGPLVAAFNKKDRAHEVCTELLATTSAQLIVPAPVLTEVCYLVETRKRHAGRGGLPCRASQGHHDARTDDRVRSLSDG